MRTRSWILFVIDGAWISYELQATGSYAIFRKDPCEWKVYAWSYMFVIRQLFRPVHIVINLFAACFFQSGSFRVGVNFLFGGDLKKIARMHAYSKQIKQKTDLWNKPCTPRKYLHMPRLHNIVFLPIKNHQNCADCQYIKIDSKVIFSIQSNTYLTVKQQHTNIKRIIFIYKWGYRWPCP
mgnify:FL=1